MWTFWKIHGLPWSVEKMTTQQLNFMSYQYILDSGQSIEEADNQESLDKEWERKLQEARERQIGKDRIVKEIQDKFIKDLSKNG